MPETGENGFNQLYLRSTMSFTGFITKQTINKNKFGVEKIIIKPSTRSEIEPNSQ